MEHFDIIDPKEFEKQYQSNYTKASVPINICECNHSIENKIKKMVSCTQKIGFTLTFAKMWHDEDPDTLYKYFTDYIYKEFPCKIEYIIAPEFTSSGILHFHGIIYNCYQRCVNKLFTKWRKNYGFIKMEYKITEHWESYILKDMDNIGFPVNTNL